LNEPEGLLLGNEIGDILAAEEVLEILGVRPLQSDLYRLHKFSKQFIAQFKTFRAETWFSQAVAKHV
jgi:hypothetical protein